LGQTFAHSAALLGRDSAYNNGRVCARARVWEAVFFGQSPPAIASPVAAVLAMERSKAGWGKIRPHGLGVRPAPRGYISCYTP